MTSSIKTSIGPTLCLEQVISGMKEYTVDVKE